MSAVSNVSITWYSACPQDTSTLNTFRKLLSICATQIVAAAAATTAVAAVPTPYTLDNTEVVATPAPHLNRAYEIYVSLPADYAKTSKRYPVVYVTDAPYAFPLVRAIAGRVDRHGVGLEGFILVGLGYAKGESGAVSRNRDYTPTDRSRERKASEGTYGKGAAYLAFLVQDVLPLVDARYRSDPQRRIYVGHSYGSLLGLQALLERPNTFSHYILGSPSLWFDRGQPFDALRRHAHNNRSDLAGKVRFYVGSLEQPTRDRPGDEDMVALLNRYVAQLRSHRLHRLDVKATVLEGEDHATVFPRLVTQGLMWALPRQD